MAFGSAPAAYRCRNHPDREGVGICVRCRNVICVECSTKIDRLNFCRSCLAVVANEGTGKRREGSRWASGPAAGLVALGMSFFALAGLYGFGALLLARLYAAMRGGS